MKLNKARNFNDNGHRRLRNVLQHRWGKAPAAVRGHVIISACRWVLRRTHSAVGSRTEGMVSESEYAFGSAIG